MTPEEAALASIHDFCARLLVACGDGADFPSHPNAIVALAARRFAHRAALFLIYGVEDFAAWELHEAVAKVAPILDPTCRFCRVRFAMFTERERDEEVARRARIAALLA